MARQCWRVVRDGKPRSSQKKDVMLRMGNAERDRSKADDAPRQPRSGNPRNLVDSPRFSHTLFISPFVPHNIKLFMVI